MKTWLQSLSFGEKIGISLSLKLFLPLLYGLFMIRDEMKSLCNFGDGYFQQEKN